MSRTTHGNSIISVKMKTTNVRGKDHKKKEKEKREERRRERKEEKEEVEDSSDGREGERKAKFTRVVLVNDWFWTIVARCFEV